MIESSRIIPILQGLLQQDLANSESISYALEEGHSVCQVQQAIDWILFASDDPGKLNHTVLSRRINDFTDPPNTNLYNQVLKVLRRVTVFNAPLCKLKLKAILAKEKQINHAVDTLILVVKDEARTANKSYMRMWSTLLSELPLSQVYRVSSISIQPSTVRQWVLMWVRSVSVRKVSFFHFFEGRQDQLWTRIMASCIA